MSCRTRSRLTLAGLAVLTAAVLGLSACGGDDTPAVCQDLEQLSSDVDALTDIDIEFGEGTIAEIEDSLDAIGADLENVKTDAEAELSEPVEDFESSLDALSSEFDTAKADDDLSAGEAQSLLDALAAVSTSFEALVDAAPDCDL
jgi:hypothetical protein